MLNLKNMTEYIEWFNSVGNQLGKEEIKVIYVESIKKKFCVCGTPMAIESALEESGYALIRAWSDMTHRNGESDIDIIEDDVDFISQMRDAAYEIIEKYLDMEIVFVCTELIKQWI